MAIRKIINVGKLHVKFGFYKAKKCSNVDHVPRKPFHGYCYGGWLPKLWTLPELYDIKARLKYGRWPLRCPQRGIDFGISWIIWQFVGGVYLRRR